MPDEPRKVEIELPEGVTQEQVAKILRDQPVTFMEIDTGYLQMVRIQKNVYKGKIYYGMQNYYKEDENQEDWQYGKTVNFPPEEIDSVIEGFQKMKAYIEGQ